MSRMNDEGWREISYERLIIEDERMRDLFRKEMIDLKFKMADRKINIST